MRVALTLARVPGTGAEIRRRLKSRLRKSQRLPSTWRTVSGCALGLAIFVFLLGVVAYEVGRGPQPSSSPGAAIAATVAKPAVALGLGAVLVVCAAACLQRLLVERLARKPGPVLVADVRVPEGLNGVDALQLSTLFRQRVQQGRFQAPTPIPGATPAQNFLRMLDADGLDAKNPLASAVKIVRAALPDHAYEVSAALCTAAEPRDDGRMCGVTAQVTRLPHEAIPIDTTWACTWEAAVRQAADVITAAILPRTRFSDRPPWTGWRRYSMPPLLIHHFEEAQELTRCRRYDEAMKSYLAALELDPKSVDLRLQLGFVQEKLGLWLDALATYVAAIEMKNETSHALYDRRARRDRHASGRVACYRAAVLLAGTRVAHQWRKQDGQTVRAQQRARLRTRLTPLLVDVLDSKYGLLGGDADTKDEPPWERAKVVRLLETHEADHEPPTIYELRNVLAHLAQRMLRDVRDEVRAPSAVRTWLSPLAVELTMRWVDLRRDWIRHALHQPRDAAWDPPIPALPDDEKFRTWTERYNAACMYALPLLVDKRRIGLSEYERSALADKAVDQLEKAMSTATSTYVASRRDWVLSEDPDLEALRDWDRFKQFETVYFPSAQRPPKRPDGVRRWEQSRYANDLIAETGRRWEKVWHRRRAHLERTVDPHAVLAWCTDEREAWKLVGELACNYRDWVSRHALIESMASWSATYEFEPLRAAVPRFGIEITPKSPQDIKPQLRLNERRLSGINTAVGEMAGLEREADLLESELRDRDFWSRRTPRLYLPYVCDVHAAMWQRLHEWLDATVDSAAADDPDDPFRDLDAAFRAAVSRAAHLSTAVTSSWMREAWGRRFHHSPHTGNGHGAAAARR
jgi:tetratricopeptide (TPR) repeat protein